MPDKNSRYTHVCYEAGNGLPRPGDKVLVETAPCEYEIRTVAEVSSIHTRQWEPNWIYLTLEEGGCDLYDLFDEDQQEAWDTLPHVSQL